MKNIFTTLKSSFLFVSAVFLLCPLLRAQSKGDIAYSVSYSPVTLALTVEVVGEGTYERDSSGKEDKAMPVYDAAWSLSDKTGATKEYSVSCAKVLTLKYGNLDLLNDLYEAGILPSLPKNYVLYAYTTQKPSEEGIHFDGFWASPKISGLEGLDLTPYLSIAKVSATSYTISKMDAENSQGIIASRVYSGKYNYKGFANMSLSTADNLTIPFVGMFSGSAVDTYWNPTPSNKSNELMVVTAPGDCTISGIVGETIIGEYKTVISGSIKISAGKAFKFTY